MSQQLNGVLFAEQISAVNRISISGQGAIEPKGASALFEGGIVTATVEEVQGGDVILRLETGELLRATNEGDMAFSKGDVIEAVVDQNTGATLLRILDLNTSLGKLMPSNSQQAISDMMAALRRNPDINAKAARFLAESGLPVNADNLQTLTQITKGPNLGVLLGQVLNLLGEQAEGVATLNALNPVAMPMEGDSARLQTENAPQDAPQGTQPQDIQKEAAPTAQNASPEVDGTSAWTVLTVRSHAEGTTTSQLKQSEGAEQTAAAQIAPENAAQAADAQEKVPTQNTAGISVEMREGDAGVQTQHTPAAADAAGKPITAQADAVPENMANVPAEVLTGAEEQNQPKAADDAALTQSDSLQKPQEGTLSKFVVQMNGEETQATLRQRADGGIRTGAGGTARGEEPLQKLVEKLLVRPGEQSGEDIKKTVDETPQTLRALKFALDQSDIKNKELCLKTVEQAIKQVEFSEKNARFDYIQLPLADNQEGKTAELYVFKRKKSSKDKADGENTTILIALDTQNIGRVETLLAAKGNQLSLEFRLEQEEHMDDFKRGQTVLEKAVEAAGFSLTGIRFSGLEKRTTLLNAADTVGYTFGEAVRGVDIRI